jgi:hypothetical protein
MLGPRNDLFLPRQERIMPGRPAVQLVLLVLGVLIHGHGHGHGKDLLFHVAGMALGVPTGDLIGAALTLA